LKTGHPADRPGHQAARGEFLAVGLYQQRRIARAVVGGQKIDGGGKIVLCGLKPSIKTVFDIAGFSALFQSFPRYRKRSTISRNKWRRNMPTKILVVDDEPDLELRSPEIPQQVRDRELLRVRAKRRRGVAETQRRW
jgi:hypothetical protein